MLGLDGTTMQRFGGETPTDGDDVAETDPDIVPVEEDELGGDDEVHQLPSCAVAGIEFGVLSADEITRMSVMEITSAAKYEKGEPKTGGIVDPRMGTVDRSLCCTT